VSTQHKQSRARQLSAAGCVVLAAFGWLHSGKLSAQPEDAGAFRIVTASHELIDTVYHVDAQIYLRLSTEATNVLRSAPLTIRIEIQFLNRLWFWLDNTEREIVLEYELEYRSVSDRYIVRDLQTDRETRRTSLPDALELIGEVNSVPVIDESVLDEDRRYDVRIRAVLDKSSLLGPQSLFSFFRRDLSISSEWFEWRLDDD
jgi:hypothetical protein